MLIILVLLTILSPPEMMQKLGPAISCAKQNRTYIPLIFEPPDRFADLGKRVEAVSNDLQWMGK